MGFRISKYVGVTNLSNKVSHLYKYLPSKCQLYSKIV